MNNNDNNGNNANSKKRIIIYEAIQLNPENEFILRFSKYNEKARETAINFLADVILNELKPKYKTELKNGFLYFQNRFICVYREKISEAYFAERIGLIHKDKLEKLTNEYIIENYKIIGFNFNLMNKFIWCEEKKENEGNEESECV